jgi:hypothetical protein
MTTRHEAELKLQSKLPLEKAGSRARLLLYQLNCRDEPGSIPLSALTDLIHPHTFFVYVATWDPYANQYELWGHVDVCNYRPMDASRPHLLFRESCRTSFPAFVAPLIHSTRLIANGPPDLGAVRRHDGNLRDLAQSIDSRIEVFRRPSFNHADTPTARMMYAATAQESVLDAVTQLLVREFLPFVCVSHCGLAGAVSTMQNWERQERELYIWRLTHTKSTNLESLFRAFKRRDYEVVKRVNGVFKTKKGVVIQCHHENVLESVLFGVPFEDALDLVRKRRCVLHRGVAWLKYSQLHHLFRHQYPLTDWSAFNFMERHPYTEKGPFKSILAPPLVRLMRFVNNPKDLNLESTSGPGVLPLPPCMKAILKHPRHLTWEQRCTFGLASAVLRIPVTVVANQFRSFWQSHYKSTAPAEERTISSFWRSQARGKDGHGPSCERMCRQGLCPFVPRSGTVDADTVMTGIGKCHRSGRIVIPANSSVKRVSMALGKFQ